MDLGTKERVIQSAEFIINTKATCRETAHKFGVNESTTYNDVTEKLPNISKRLTKKVREVLDEHRAEAHIRGYKKSILSKEIG